MGTQAATEKKTWVKPQVTERSSASRAEAKKPYRTLEATIVVGGISVQVGPGS